MSKKEIFIWKGTKEQATQICINAFSELLEFFRIVRMEDLFTKELIVKMTPIELKENGDKLVWFEIFMRHRKEIRELL